jgi:DNA-binding Lrp family transcriptional regulator
MTMATETRKPSGWTFLTNHAHVLLCIAADPSIRIREIASLVGITERAAQRIVAELESEGYVSHHRVGRRNRYVVYGDRPLRHPLEHHLGISALLRALTIEIPSRPTGQERHRAAVS